MTSLFFQASRACLNTSARAARSASLAQRSFITLSSNGKGTSVCCHQFPHSRYDSSFASAQRLDSVSTPTSLPSEAELPSFLTLKDAVSEQTLRAITGNPMNLTTMSPVQAAVFPLLPELADPYNPQTSIKGPPRDLLVKAKTGTGKTLAFLLPAIEARIKSIEAHSKKAVLNTGLNGDRALEERAKRAFARESVGTLIISPTRELAMQIASEALRVTKHLKDFQVRLFVGGASKRFQMREWMQGRRDIVVATPGRLRDCLNSEPEVVRGISKTQLLVLDEADTLLDMGFRPDIEAIKEYLPPVPERQTFLFSATVSRSIQQIAESTLSPNHKFINCVASDSSPVHAHVPQYHTVLPDASHQIPHVLRLIAHDQLTNPGASKIILFLPTTKMTQLFAEALNGLSGTSLPAGRNTRIFEIHSKRTMDKRISTSAAFRNDKSGASILVTSDVSARGVDYPNVSRVIQVGIPGKSEQYVHRVGRTGRAGTNGRGDLVILPWELDFVSSQLTTVPLKPLTAAELTSQTKKLAAAFDANPSEFLANTPVKSVRFNEDVTQIIEEVDNDVAAFLVKLPVESVRETFMSLVGYYISIAGELRITKDAVVEGCKQWAVEACGLPTPPYISKQFLARLGLVGTNSRGSGSGSRGYQGRDRNSWAERTPSRPRTESSTYQSRSFANRENSSSQGYSADGGYGSRSRSSYGRRADNTDGSSWGGYASRREEGGQGRSRGDRSSDTW